MISDDDYALLIHGGKHFLWTLALDPPVGRKRASPTTLHLRTQNLKRLLVWMAIDGVRRFVDLDQAAVGRFISWLQAQPRLHRHNGNLAPQALVKYLIVIKDLYRQRAKLEDAPQSDPFPLETTGEVAGTSRATNGAVPFIPDAIAVYLLSKALEWVETSADTIITADLLRTNTQAAAPTRGCAKSRVWRTLHAAALVDPLAGPLNSPRLVRAAVAHLVSACFIVIAGFVGMRVSEILSMKAGGIEHRPIGKTGLAQAYIVARLFKMVGEPDGREERWTAPPVVVGAVSILERLSEPYRMESGRDELFLFKTPHREVSLVTGIHIDTWINGFADAVGVPLHEGRPWRFTTHQFRKTFARFIARRDRSQLLGLAEHFKHASVAMTARGYVGSDFDLHQLIEHESHAETAAALDRLLVSDRLAGRMGERIVAGNERFRGRAGEQVRRDYISFVLRETDLRLYACDYGWCVFQPETARCGGEVGPSEIGRSPATCLSCANMVIEERHAAYWRDRRERNASLMARASPMTAAVLAEAITQCDRVLVRIGNQDAQK
jgi:integrase